MKRQRGKVAEVAKQVEDDHGRGADRQRQRQIALWIGSALESRGDDAALTRIRGEVLEMANRFPLYAWRREMVAAAV